jgi:hypothetical protein
LRRLVVCDCRGVNIGVASDHVAVAASYSSVLLIGAEPLKPPATKTRPSPRKVAVWSDRADSKLAAGDQDPGTPAETWCAGDIRVNTIASAVDDEAIRRPIEPGRTRREVGRVSISMIVTLG